MCGVCGVVSGATPSAATESDVRDLNAAQRHRGPDDEQVWAGAGVALGHTRLAIVDLGSGGRQPFSTSNGSVQIIFNGEIYNHEELRVRHSLDDRLARCDGAILPALWDRMGTAMFQELRGMFAIAVVDTRNNRLTLARDVFGIKPLYYRQSAGQVIFASEVRALTDSLTELTLRKSSLRRFLSTGSMGRDESPFEQIECVPANTWLQFQDGSLPDSETIEVSPFDGDATRPDLRPALIDSVKVHLRSDVPTALLLSSGLDSGALAWAAAELDQKLTCVTVEMGGGRDESAGAAAIATRFGHGHIVALSPPGVDRAESFFESMQRPSIDGLNTFLVSHAIADEGFKVALSGMGADEVLGGYSSFRWLRALRVLGAADRVKVTRPASRALDAAGLSRRWPKARDLLDPHGPRDSAGLSRLTRRVLPSDDVKRLFPSVSSGAAKRDGRMDGRALSEAEVVNYLGGTLLPDADAFSMAWSIELRVPFVDVPFARTALAQDPRRGVGKKGFAAALGDSLLAQVAATPKQGFTLPMDSWMRSGPLRTHVERARAIDSSVGQLLDRNAVEDLFEAWELGNVRWSRGWLLASLNSWIESFGSKIDLNAVR